MISLIAISFHFINQSVYVKRFLFLFFLFVIFYSDQAVVTDMSLSLVFRREWHRSIWYEEVSVTFYMPVRSCYFFLQWLLWLHQSLFLFITICCGSLSDAVFLGLPQEDDTAILNSKLQSCDEHRAQKTGDDGSDSEVWIWLGPNSTQTNWDLFLEFVSMTLSWFFRLVLLSYLLAEVAVSVAVFSLLRINYPVLIVCFGFGQVFPTSQFHIYLIQLSHICILSPICPACDPVTLLTVRTPGASIAVIFSASLSSTLPSLVSSYAGDSHRISHQEDLWCWYPLVLCLSNDLLYLSPPLPFSHSLSSTSRSWLCCQN